MTAVGAAFLPLLPIALAADPPRAADDRVVYSSSQAVNGWFAVDVLANDSVTEVRAVELVSAPTDGVVEPTNRPVGFRWKRGSRPTAQWTYRIVDAAGIYSNTAFVSVGVRVGPHPQNDTYEAADSELLRVSAPGVLANDRHPDGEPLIVEGLSHNGFTAHRGRYVMARDGSFEYAPPPGFTGSDSFRYRVVDPQSDAAEATVAITVRTRQMPSEPVHDSKGDRPATDKPEVTVHLYGYPSICARSAIIVGGRVSNTWLDESHPGARGSPYWKFIDLHAIIPDGVTAGVRAVEFRCGGNTYPAGSIKLPTTERLTTFELTWCGEPSTLPPATEPARTPPGADPTSPWKLPPSSVMGMPTFSEVSTEIQDIIVSAAMSAWFIILVLLLEVAFPADLVNKIIELVRTLHKDKYKATAPRPRLPTWLRGISYTLVGGVLLAWADHENTTADMAAATLKTAAGTASLLLVLLAYEKPKDLLLRSVRGPSRLSAIWFGFVIAAAMATLSRFLELPVPYVYGLVVVYVAIASTEGKKLPNGRAALGGGITVLVVSVTLWIMAEPLIQAARQSVGATEFALAHAACMVIAAGIQVVVFGLMSIKPLDGHYLKKWNRFLWWALYPATVFIYFHVVLNTVDQPQRATTLYLASGLFVTAGCISLLLRRTLPHTVH